MQAFLANFVYYQRTEVIFAKGQEALLHLCEENQKLIAEHSEANVIIEKATNMIGMAADSLEQVESYKKTSDEEVAKLREELLKERASREEAWKTLKDERRVHEENLQSEKAAFDVVLEKERGLRGAA